MTRVVLIVNPSSGKEMAETYAEKFEKELLKRYDEVHKRLTEKGGDAARFAKEAARDNVDAIFAIGGDGTVSECIQGLAAEPNRPPFGFLPGGTVNSLGRELNKSMDSEKVIEQFSTMELKQLDVGKVNGTYFIGSVSVGAIPEAIHDVSVEEKTESGALAYVNKGVQALKGSKSYSFSLRLDEEKVQLHSPLVVVSVGHTVGGIKHVIPGAERTDGKLHVLALIGESIVGSLTAVPKVFFGDITEDDHIFYRRIEEGEIAVEGQERIMSNIDGDEGEPLPLEIKVLPNHITFFVPSDYQD